METFLFIVNLIGTVAFAAAGAMTGLQKNMDIFGSASWASPPPWAAASCGT